jgi:prephenate dehydrogenase/chorismate mutase
LDEIPRIRERIDEIDQQLIQLLNDRCENARQLGRIKKVRHIEFRDPERERIILEKVRAATTRLGLDPKLTIPIFKDIFKLSVQAQQSPAHDHTAGLDGKKILIVGGTGGMGRFMTSFASLHNAAVKIVGRNTQRTQKIARELEVEPGSISNAQESDIVIIAVPTELVAKMSLEAAQFMRKGALLTDLSSVKVGIADRVSAKMPEGLEYVSIHPLFGPRIDHLRGKNLVAIPFKTGPEWSALSRTFRRAGARVHVATIEHHDRAMAYVQVLHHFALLSLGVAMRNWDGKLRTSSIIGTMQRIEDLLSNWDTIVGIQKLNPYSSGARREFAKTSGQLVGMKESDLSRIEGVLRSDVQKWTRKL